MDSNDYIFGVHPTLEAIEAGRTIDKLFIKKDLHGDLAIRLCRMAREAGIPVQRVPVERLNRITRKNHQGVIAQMSAVDYCRLSDIVPTLFEDGVLPFILVLDGITDVRNFGAIARTAECCGVNAIVIPSRGSVSVGADAGVSRGKSCQSCGIPAIKRLSDSLFDRKIVAELYAFRFYHTRCPCDGC